MHNKPTIARKDFKEMARSVKEFTGARYSDMAIMTGRTKGGFTSHMYGKGRGEDERMIEEVAYELLMPFLFGSYIPPLHESMTQEEIGRYSWESRDDLHDPASVIDELHALKKELNTTWELMADYWEMHVGTLTSFIYDDQKYITDVNRRAWRRRINKLKTLPERTKREKFYFDRTQSQIVAQTGPDKAPLINLLRIAKGSGTWKDLSDAMGGRISVNSLIDFCAPSHRSTTSRKRYDELENEVLKVLQRQNDRLKSVEAQQDSAHEEYRTGQAYTKRMLRRLPSTLTS